MGEFRTYVACSGGEAGIWLCRLHADKGTLAVEEAFDAVRNSSFLALSPDRRHLYCTGSVPGPAEEETGRVHAFRIDRATGALDHINQQCTHGSSPCHVRIAPDGRSVLVSNFRGVGDVGGLSVLPARKDGGLGKALQVLRHEGSSVHPTRQRCSHVHSTAFSPDGRHVYAADLGIDKVMIYRFDQATGRLTPADPPFAQAAAGSGPRHIAFHPRLSCAYVINETNNTMTAFRCDDETGSLAEMHSLSALPENWKADSACADVHVSPDGRYVYGSNRGHDSIVAYSVDQETGRMRPGAHTPCRGEGPRAFALDPTGRAMVVANAGSGTAVVFRVDRQNGAPEPTGSTVSMPGPVCVEIAPSG